MINREQYMEQIVPFIDKPFVKSDNGYSSQWKVGSAASDS